MWTYKITNKDRNGFRPEVKITVEFTNGKDTLEKIYEILPEEYGTLDSQIQSQLDILNHKEAIIISASIISVSSIAVGSVIGEEKP